LSVALSRVLVIGFPLRRYPPIALLKRTRTVGFGTTPRPKPRQEKPLNRARVLLADDHEDFLAVAARLLAEEFDVVNKVGDGQALLGEAARLEPDVLVLDISMPVLSGIEAARQLQATGCRARIIFLTVHDDPDYVRAAFAAGALGYVVKCRLASDLLFALREVLAGRSFVSPCISLE
jgi:DNA-binding NarL/FixJ family response regulator